MADLDMLRHSFQTGVQVVTCGCIQLRLADLAVHLVLQLVKQRAGFAVNLHLQVYKAGKILLLLLRILLHQLSQGFSFDVFGDDRPAAVDHGYSKNLRNIEPCFFDTGLVQCFVQHVRLGIVLIKYLDAFVPVAIYGLAVPNCNNPIQIHYPSLLTSFGFSVSVNVFP